MMSIDKMRRNYTIHGLDIADVAADPVEQFHNWFEEALTCSPGEWFEPNAMTLATADRSGRVAARIVLLKGFDRGGPLFFTNYESDKGRALAENPRVALCFYWPHQERQVRIEGAVEAASVEISDRYFQSRPRRSQLGALASPQSIAVESRRVLESRMAELESEYGDREIPRPAHWGGYRVIPARYEFWQGRQDRLHDRIAYRADGGGGWIVERLAP